MKGVCKRVMSRSRRNETGSALLEFAITASVLLLVVVGFFEFVIGIYSYQFVVSAAQKGARYAIVRGGHWGGAVCSSTAGYDCSATEADVTAYVKSLATPGIAADSIAVNAQWPEVNTDGDSAGCTNYVNNPGCEVKVEVSYPFNFQFPFISGSTITFRSTSVMTIQQ